MFVQKPSVPCCLFLYLVTITLPFSQSEVVIGETSVRDINGSMHTSDGMILLAYDLLYKDSMPRLSNCSLADCVSFMVSSELNCLSLIAVGYKL